jgi:hypothetical protein
MRYKFTRQSPFSPESRLIRKRADEQSRRSVETYSMPVVNAGLLVSMELVRETPGKER